MSQRLLKSRVFTILDINIPKISEDQNQNIFENKWERSHMSLQGDKAD